MVTTFNQKDLVSFGRYLSSPERRALFEATQERAPTSLEERLTDVYHSDIENWIEWKQGVEKVRSKFECTHIEFGDDVNPNTVHFSACIEGSPENKRFSEYTPSGNINICIDKSCRAMNLFEQGKQYFVDFIKSD